MQLLNSGERAALVRSIHQHLVQPGPARPVLTREDLFGAVACFWLVLVSCFPAALPFFIFDNPITALRVSNGLLLLLLFLVGYKWARHVGTNPWLAGGGLLAIGLILVGIAVLLGG